MKLFEIVKKYLETNGISIRYFSDCIGVSPNVGGKWLRGDIKKLPAEKMEKIYAFLNEEYHTTVDEMKLTDKLSRNIRVGMRKQKIVNKLLLI